MPNVHQYGFVLSFGKVVFCPFSIFILSLYMYHFGCISMSMLLGNNAYRKIIYGTVSLIKRYCGCLTWNDPTQVKSGCRLIFYRGFTQIGIGRDF